MTDILYADLVTAIGSNALTPGEFYRITDYQTTFYIYDYGTYLPVNTNITDSGSVEPLIIQALTNNTLSQEAKSENYPADIISYTIDNIDSGLFASTAGTILRRLDNNNKIDMQYDYRAVYITMGGTPVPTLPTSAYNVRIGQTTALDGTYTQTIPVCIETLALNISIDLINEETGMYLSTAINSAIGVFAGGIPGTTFISSVFQTFNITNASGTYQQFIGGHATIFPNVGSNVGVNNSNVANTNPKIAIPGGYFVEMTVVDGPKLQSFYIGDYIP